MRTCQQNKSADFRHTQSWLTTSHNNPTRKSAPYGTHSRIIILARSFVEVVIQTAIELICKGAISPKEYRTVKLAIIRRLTKVYVHFISFVVKIVGIGGMRRGLGLRIKLNSTVHFRFPKRIEVVSNPFFL